MNNQSAHGAAPCNIYAHMLAQPHLLIGGTTGSGKSTLLDCLIYTVSQLPPSAAQLILIDPKYVGLPRWSNLPHVLHTVSGSEGALETLEAVASLMYRRFRAMSAEGLTESRESDLWVVIDEFAALTLRDKRAERPLIDMAQMGRAAHIHLILATQSPSRKVITPQIKLNMTSVVALRCVDAIESRLLIGRSGAEQLPRWGRGIYLCPDLMQPTAFDLPPIPSEALQAAMYPVRATPAPRDTRPRPGSIFHRTRV